MGESALYLLITTAGNVITCSIRKGKVNPVIAVPGSLLVIHHCFIVMDRTYW